MLAIWLVYDLGEHANDFQEAHLGFQPIAQFYLVQIPFIIVNQLPLSVLLGLLYVLTRMSRRNEIVSMLGAGVSVPRLLLPLILIGLLLTAGCTVRGSWPGWSLPGAGAGIRRAWLPPGRRSRTRGRPA